MAHPDDGTLIDVLERASQEEAEEAAELGVRNPFYTSKLGWSILWNEQAVRLKQLEAELAACKGGQK